MDKNSLNQEISHLFDDVSPAQAWDTAEDIICCLNPAYDFGHLRMVFDDVVDLFQGRFPGYCEIRAPYHNLNHTLDVFMCTVRMMHGVQVAGEARFEDDCISQLCIAAMLHDVGYAQRKGEASGTGAQFTQSHIERGIEFVRHYLTERELPAHWPEALSCMIRSTSLQQQFSDIAFPDAKARLAGKILGSSDLVGQMASRNYIEKLLLLYLEFKEARFGEYGSMYELLHKTQDFYRHILTLLDQDFDNVYSHLSCHFQEYLGNTRNYYRESIDRNIAYLARVLSLDEDCYLSMLKRDGIVQQALRQSGVAA